MIISHKKKFIFIHIYKTGGAFVTSLFAPYARFIEKISTHYYLTKNIISVINKLGRLQDEGNNWINGVHKHAKAVELQEYMGRDLDIDYESIGTLNQSKRLKNYRLYYSDKLKKQVYKYYQKYF